NRTQSEPRATGARRGRAKPASVAFSQASNAALAAKILPLAENQTHSIANLHPAGTSLATRGRRCNNRAGHYWGHQGDCCGWRLSDWGLSLLTLTSADDTVLDNGGVVLRPRSGLLHQLAPRPPDLF